MFGQVKEGNAELYNCWYSLATAAQGPPPAYVGPHSIWTVNREWAKAPGEGTPGSAAMPYGSVSPTTRRELFMR